MTTPSQRGKSNRRKGAQAERDVVNWLRAHGFPQAERAIATGARSGDRVRPDLGDITGTPGVVWQVKDQADLETPSRLTPAMRETGRQKAAAHAAYGVLVQRKRGTGDVGQWYAWMTAHDYAFLATGLPGRSEHPVRTSLADVVDLLRDAGFGDPVDTEEAS